MNWREDDGVRWLEADLGGATAAFSTRLGGVSGGEFAELNLGLHTGDDPDAVLKNRARLASALGRQAEGFLFGHQVHGAEVSRRDAAPSPNPYLDASLRPEPGDGQVTAGAGLTALVQVADCLPVAIRGERGVAMLHCGWRGLAGGIVERGVAMVGGRSAAVGPGIGPCCYEVGPEVSERFARIPGSVGSPSRLDLPEIARRLLFAAGVADVELSGLCTSCERELFFSHRRDGGRTGRQGGLVWVEDHG